MKDHAEYLTDEQIAAEIDKIKHDIAEGKISEDEAERDAYFSDPANAEAIAEQFARMELVEALYKARKEAGLTQQKLAEKLGTNQTYIAALERGRKNITFATLTRYAHACGEKIAISLT